jgi:hypothetical protein
MRLGNMKIIIGVLLTFLIIGCKAGINNQIIAEKYIEGFYEKKISFAYNQKANKDEKLFSIIDTIIEQTKNHSINQNVKQEIVDEIKKIPEPQFDAQRSQFNKMKKQMSRFKNNQLIFIEDLNFIDQFLTVKYWQYWSCNMGPPQIETLISMDTIFLMANKEYELPIRVEYNGRPTAFSIVSNSIQGNRPNTIKFITKSVSQKYQMVSYECKALNETTGESMTYKDQIVIKLIKND